MSLTLSKNFLPCVAFLGNALPASVSATSVAFTTVLIANALPPSITPLPSRTAVCTYFTTEGFCGSTYLTYTA